MIPRRILQILLVGLLAGSVLETLAPWTLDPPPAHADGPGDWPMFGHDPAHTGYNPDETNLKPPLRLKWSYRTGGVVVSSPAVADGVLYAGASDYNVYALDAVTGALRWSFTTGSTSSTPAVVSGVVYIGCGTKVCALDAVTGALRWSFNTGYFVYSSAPVVANSIVYIGSGDRKVYALDATTGAFKWSYTTGNMIYSSPAVANGVVYVGSDDKKVYAFSAANGDLKWSYSTGNSVFSSPAVADGVVYVGSGDGFGNGELYALDAATGGLKWSYTTTAYIGASPVVANGVVYVGGGDHKVYALDAATGALGWSYATGGLAPTSAAVANGVVYVGSDDYKVSALDANSGTLRWSYTTGGRDPSPPAVANGVVYVGSNDYKVYAFEAQPPLVSIQLLPYQADAFPISWAVPLTWTGTAASSYDAQYRDGPAGAWTDLITATSTLSATFTGGQDGHSYYFRARSHTATGSLGDWSDPISTTVDLTAPTGSISIAAGAIYSNNPVALELSASDATSGVSQMALSDDGIAWGSWQDHTGTKSRTLPAPDGPKTVYVKYADAAGNVSPVYSGTVVLDTIPPTGTISINGASSDTNSQSVTLSLTAADERSGVAQMSFSNDGQTYSSWQDYASSRAWNLSGGNGHKTVYVKYSDNAGNISSPATAIITLNTTLPSSGVIPLSAYQNTASFAVSWSGSALGSGLASFDVQYRDGSTGQWTDWVTGTLSTTAVFTGTEGQTYYFQSRARDLAGNVQPYAGGDGDTHTTIDLTPPSGSLSINDGALDTTSVAATLVVSATDSLSGVSQASYSSDGSSWSAWATYTTTTPWTLPSGDGDKTVWARLKDVAGNISSPVSDTIRLDTSMSAAYGFSINEGALFTSQVTVTLDLPANPNTAQMMVSNDGGFYGATWESYAAYRPWAITQYGSYVIARTVYVKFKDVAGNVSGVYQDDIILDLNAPSGTVSIEGSGTVTGTNAVATTAVTLRLSASDDVSGVGGMLVSNSPAFSGASWESLAASKSWNMESGGKVYVAFKDNAGNASPVYAASLSGGKESLPAVVLGSVHPKTGGQLASAETNTTVAFPPGAVEAKAEVVLVPAVETALQGNTGALRGTGKFLTLTAKAGETSVTSVSKPYTITVSYTAAEVVGMDESTLGIYWWSSGAWQKEPKSQVNVTARAVSASINHLSSFAVLGESSMHRVFLPLVARSHSAGW